VAVTRTGLTNRAARLAPLDGEDSIQARIAARQRR